MGISATFTDRQTDSRERERETDRQTDSRERERETDRQTKSDAHTKVIVKTLCWTGLPKPSVKPKGLEPELIKGLPSLGATVRGWFLLR